MDNNSVAVVEKQAPFRSIVEQLTTLGVSKDYKNGGGSVRWKNKQEFKKEYLAKPENKLGKAQLHQSAGHDDRAKPWLTALALRRLKRKTNSSR